MTVAQLTRSVETPASILENEVIPSLDKIILDHGHKLRPSEMDYIRRVVGTFEEMVNYDN